MAEALGRVRQTLLEALEADCAVRPSAFDASFSREQLAAFVLDSLLGQMSRGADNCEGLEPVSYTHLEFRRSKPLLTLDFWDGPSPSAAAPQGGTA